MNYLRTTEADVH